MSDVEVPPGGVLLLQRARAAPNVAASTCYGPDRSGAAGVHSTAPSPHGGVHTANLSARSAGRRYVFAARNPCPSRAARIYDAFDPTSFQIGCYRADPAVYGIHYKYVPLMGLPSCSPVIIYDAGHGMAGGSPASPVEVSRLVMVTPGLKAGPSGPQRGWRNQDPVTHEARYLFIGQEGPGILGTGSSGVIESGAPRDLGRMAQVETSTTWMSPLDPVPRMPGPS